MLNINKLKYHSLKRKIKKKKKNKKICIVIKFISKKKFFL